MRHNSLGLCPAALVAPDGTLISAPYRLPAHGLMLANVELGLVVLVLLVCSIEDPRFAVWLAGRGIYRVEDATGSVARVGEGHLIDRIRRHRAAPAVTPVRLTAILPTDAAWPLAERQFLEGAVANEWIRSGNALATSRFTRHFPGLDRDRERHLRLVFKSAMSLVALADRILDDDADELTEARVGEFLNWPNPRVPARAIVESDAPARRVMATRATANPMAFPAGTSLFYSDGSACAWARARGRDVFLQPGSTVYRTPSANVGRRFREAHGQFLSMAAVTGAERELPMTTVTVVTDTAAYLLKLITAGRCHGAARWRVLGRSNGGLNV